MTKARIDAGICGFITNITASSEDDQNVSFKITSDCENIQRLSKLISTVDAYNELKDGFDGVLYTAIRKVLKGCCSGCAVPVGLFKAMQVAAKVALPKDVNITISKE